MITEKYIDSDGQELIKETDNHYNVRYYNKQGQRHRLDGPSFSNVNGEKIWYKNGKFHREDGPAVIYSSGTKFWYKDGLLHREDGPAYIGSNGTEEYHYKGIELETEQDLKIMYLKDMCDKL